MYPYAYAVQITNIIFVFTDHVLPKQAEQLRVSLLTHQVKDICIYNQKENLESVFSKEKHPDFCITDIPEVCLKAKEHGVPSLFYLHDENRDASMDGIPYAVTGFEGIDYPYLCDIYKRFFYIPWTILETERCLVREMTEDDLDALYEVYRDPGISLYTENLYEDPQQERAYIRDYIEHVYRLCGLGMWVIILKETGKLIGRAGLAWREGYETPEIGFVVAKDFQRQGYAFEVCDAILHYCEDLEFDCIRVIYQKENSASHGLCKKLGFSIECECETEGKDMIHAVKKLSGY